LIQDPISHKTHYPPPILTTFGDVLIYIDLGFLLRPKDPILTRKDLFLLTIFEKA
jgi:hypothetical protein